MSYDVVVMQSENENAGAKSGVMQPVQVRIWPVVGWVGRDFGRAAYARKKGLQCADTYTRKSSMYCTPTCRPGLMMTLENRAISLTDILRMSRNST